MDKAWPCLAALLAAGPLAAAPASPSAASSDAVVSEARRLFSDYDRELQARYARSFREAETEFAALCREGLTDCRPRAFERFKAPSRWDQGADAQFLHALARELERPAAAGRERALAARLHETARIAELSQQLRYLLLLRPVTPASLAEVAEEARANAEAQGRPLPARLLELLPQASARIAVYAELDALARADAPTEAQLERARTKISEFSALAGLDVSGVLARLERRVRSAGRILPDPSLLR